MPGKIKILILEHHDGIAGGIKKILESKGYEVTAVKRCEDAVKACLSRSPDICILDMDMDTLKEAGLETLSMIKRMDSKTYCIVSNMGGKEGVIKRAKDTGADDFLNKPFSTKDLLAVVEKAEEVLKKI